MLFFSILSELPGRVAVVCPGERSNPWGGYSKPVGNLVIPSSVQYDGVKYSVVMIGDNAFAGCGGLKAVVVPPSVVNIGTAAFAGCPALKSVTIDCDSLHNATTIFSSYYESAVTAIDTLTIGPRVRVLPSFAFCELNSLKVVNFWAENPEFMNYLFFGCQSNATLCVGSQVTTIPPSMCYNFEGLRSIKGADQLQVIGENAFVNCTQLHTIVLPQTLRDLGYSCFAHCNPSSIVVEQDSMAWMTEKPFLGVDSNTTVFINCAARVQYSMSRFGRYFGRPKFKENCPDLHEVQMPEVVHLVDTVVVHDTIVVHDTVWLSTEGDASSEIHSPCDDFAVNAWIQKNVLYITVTELLEGVKYSVYDTDGLVLSEGRLPEANDSVPFKLKLSKKQRLYIRLAECPPILLDMPNGLIHK